MKASPEEIERHRAAERLKGQRDAAGLLATAEKKGIDLGIEKGIDLGLLIGRIQLLQQFLGQPETSREELARLSIPDLVQLEETLKRQFSIKKQTNGTPPPDPT